MLISRKLISLIFALLGVVIFYSVIMGVTSFGFILDGYYTWYEHNTGIAIAEFSLVVAIFSIAIWVLSKLRRSSNE